MKIINWAVRISCLTLTCVKVCYRVCTQHFVIKTECKVKFRYWRGRYLRRGNRGPAPASNGIFLSRKNCIGGIPSDPLSGPKNWNIGTWTFFPRHLLADNLSLNKEYDNNELKAINCQPRPHDCKSISKI